MSEDAKHEPSETRTRTKLLAVAGRLFAERGLDGVTAKQICECAAVNPAAVNYHFGGLQGLYEAVLVEARRRTISGDRRLDLMLLPTQAEEKLRAMIALAVKALLAPAEVSWVAQLFGRELTHPTPIGERILGPVVQPRVEMARALVGEFVSLSPDDPRVDLACISLAAPLQMLLIRNRDLLLTHHPALTLLPETEATLIDHFCEFAFAGLRTLKVMAQRPSTVESS